MLLSVILSLITAFYGVFQVDYHSSIVGPKPGARLACAKNSDPSSLNGERPQRSTNGPRWMAIYVQARPKNDRMVQSRRSAHNVVRRCRILLGDSYGPEWLQLDAMPSFFHIIIGQTSVYGGRGLASCPRMPSNSR
jgi:hypothetical protein